ncbi:MAG TPA: translation initiation factor IF-2 [Stenomitos sp.]
MNNGKVRIYELSRELDLDNKHILDICEDLNIAVKSHSSTITESEAERIRAASEKLAVRSRGGAASTEGGTGAPAHKFATRPKGQPRQQIVGIKPKSPTSPRSQQEENRVGVPPQPPVRPSVAPPKPTLNRPAIKQPERSSEPIIKQESPELEEIERVPADVEVEAQPAQLAGPPLRPTQPKNPQLTQVERPILKRERSEPAPAKPSGTPAPRQPVSSNQSSTTTESSPPARRSAAPVAPVQPKLYGPPKRPQPPREGQDADVAATLGVDDFAGPDEDIEGISSEIKELKAPKRLTPPRPPTKKKEWVDEDDESQELAKAGKAGAKLKRRPELFEDDEEDFEDQLAELGAPVIATQAIARPAKPKSQQKQPVSATMPTTSQRRKPGVRGSGDHSKSDARDRQRDKKAAPERPETIELTGSVTIRELATALGIAETEIIKKLFFKGMAVSITQTLDIPTASLVAEELGVTVQTTEEEPAARKGTVMVGEEDNLYRRPPVVTIMGHVDHGKTTLLDAIRETKVAQGEAGGITQHIGAYHVDVDHEGQTQQVVFLDTPGHEAFTAMRARGARVTDIAILVVAADDGVQPQTVEAISHAQAAEVPIVVAINKIDKPGAQPDRVKQELTDRGLQPEEWGGDTIMVPVSAIQKENLDTLLEMILLVAEVEDLHANPNRPARGTVIEANLDKTRGPVATLLVQNGTLRVGDTLVAGSVFCKVRAMIDDRGARVEAAGPSFAVEVLGLNEVPAAGDEFEVFVSEKEARSTANKRADEQRQSRLQQVMASRRVTLNSLSAQAQEGELKELNLILKADVQGSVEAILGALRQLPQNEVQIRVLLAGAGEVTETDVDLAAASGAVIIGFNTTLAHGSRHAADREGVDIREYNIIYKLLDDIQGAMEGLLEPEMVEEPLGQVEVRAVFPVGRGAVAGCYVLTGKAVRNCNIRVRRGSKVIHEGILDSLKRMKDDAKEVSAGYECGVGLDKFNDWAEGDIIETFKMVSRRRTLSAT